MVSVAMTTYNGEKHIEDQLESLRDQTLAPDEVVIFDEPTASLDPVNVEILEGILDKKNKVGKTLLISTHDVDFAYRWADRAVIFAGGRIIADGPVQEVFKDDEVLNQANLKRPVLLEVYNSLVRHHVLEEAMVCPKDAGELEMLLKTQRN